MAKKAQKKSAKKVNQTQNYGQELTALYALMVQFHQKLISIHKVVVYLMIA